MASEYFLSVIVPAYNEADKIKSSLAAIKNYFDGNGFKYEIIVIDDGSVDKTLSIAREFSIGEENIKIISNANRQGKGFSVKKGVLETRSEYILISDADLSAPLEEIERLWPWAGVGFDIVIGSRFNFNRNIRTRVEQKLLRRILGLIFNLCVRILVIRGIRDTQCGFKLFRGSSAREVFSTIHIDGFAFDVEVLFLAKKMGYKLKEVPINWKDRSSSKVSSLTDPWRMLRDLIRIKMLSFCKNSGNQKYKKFFDNPKIY